MGRRIKISPEAAAIADALNAEDRGDLADISVASAPERDPLASESSPLVALLILRERPPFDDEYVDTQTLALVHKLSPSYFEKLRVTGGGPPYIKMGSAVRYRFGDAKIWAAQRFVRGSTSESEPADAA